MKKIILISFIAVIAVFNFTLVKSKTGEVTLKSLTELAQANAEEICGSTIYGTPYTENSSYTEEPTCNYCGKTYTLTITCYTTYQTVTQFIYNTVLNKCEARTTTILVSSHCTTTGGCTCDGW